MLTTLANTAIHRLNTMSSTMAISVTIETHDFTATHGFLTRSVTSPISRGLSIMVQADLELSKV